MPQTMPESAVLVKEAISQPPRLLHVRREGEDSLCVCQSVRPTAACIASTPICSGPIDRKKK